MLTVRFRQVQARQEDMKMQEALELGFRLGLSRRCNIRLKNASYESFKLRFPLP